jgi:PPM family protein phosphatase
MKKTLSTYAVSLLGHRDENQDRYKIFYDKVQSQLLVVVADGMGGHRGGSLAAQAIIQAASQCWDNRAQGATIEDWLKNMTAKAHDNVIAVGKANHLSPKSTFVALYIDHDTATSAHVGDSRVLQFNHKGLIQRTLDHSVAQLKVFQGKINEQDMAQHPDQSKLYASIGDEQAPVPEITQWQWQRNNLFVVCSDGYWELYDCDEMAAAVNTVRSTQDLERAVSGRIKQHEQHDNTTAVIVDTRSRKDKQKPAYWKMIALVGITLVCIAAYLNLIFLPSLPAEQNDPVNKPHAHREGGKKNSIEKSSTEPDKPRSTEGGISEAPVIETQRKQVDIPAASTEQAAAKTEKLMKRNGDIGNHDSLDADGDAKTLGSGTVLKLQQKHKGIPIYGAQTHVIIEEGRITDIESKSISDVDIDVNPKMTYQGVIKKNNDLLDEPLTPQGAGHLIIYNSHSGYRLAWQGLVATQNSLEDMIFDAGSADILLRYSAVIKDELD